MTGVSWAGGHDDWRAAQARQGCQGATGHRGRSEENENQERRKSLILKSRGEYIIGYKNQLYERKVLTKFFFLFYLFKPIDR